MSYRQQIPRSLSPNQKFSDSQMRFMNDMVRQQPQEAQQIVGQQLLQLTPEQIHEIQNKLEHGEVLTGLKQLPAGAQPTHKFVVKLRRPVVEERPRTITPTQPTQYPCPNCPRLQDIINKQNQEIDQLKKALKDKDKEIQQRENEHENHKQQLYEQLEQLESQPPQQQDENLQAGPPPDDEEQQQLRQQCQILKNNVEHLEDEIHERDRYIDQLLQKINILESNRVDNYELESLRDQLRTKSKEVELLNTRIFVQDQGSRTEEQLIQVKRLYEDLQQQYQLECQQTQQLRKKLEELKREYQSFSMSNRDDGRKAELESQLYQKDERIRQLQMEINRIQSISIETVSRRDYQDLQDQIEIWKNKYSTLESRQLSQSDGRLMQLRKDIEILQQQLAFKNSELEAVRSQQSVEFSTREMNLRRELEQRESQIYDLSSQIESWKLKYQKLDQNQYQFQSLRSEYEQLQQLLQKRNQEIISIKSQYESEITTYKTQIQQISIRVQNNDELDAWKSRFSQLEQRFNSLKQDYQDLQQNTLYKEKEIEQWKFKLQKSEQEITTYKTQIQQISIRVQNNEELDAWKSRFSQLEQRFNSLKQDYQDLQQTILYKEKEIEQWKSKLQKQEQSQYQIQESRFISLKGEFELLQTQYQKKQQELNQIRSQYESKISQMTLEFQSNNYRDEVEIWKQKFLSFKSDNQELQQQLMSKQQEIENLRMKYQSDMREYQDKLAMSQQLEQRLRGKDEEIQSWKVKFESIQSSYFTLQQNYETIQITTQENSNTDILKQEIKRLQKTIVELRSEIDKLLVQQTDNQWLQKRYQEQQHIIEELKMQSDRNIVQKEYTYQVNTQTIPQAQTGTFYRETSTNPTISVTKVNENLSQTREVRYENRDSSQNLFPRYQNLYRRTNIVESYTNTTNDMKKSKAEFEKHHWGNDYNEVVESVVRREKFTY